MTTCSDPISATADLTRRHRSGSAWTDRGTALLAAGGPGGRDALVNCHKRAVKILGGLPISENAGYLADLGAAWVNMGCALQAGASRESLEEALDAFDRAVELLGQLPLIGNPRFRHNLSAAWMNLADTFVRIDTATGRRRALQAYERAIEIARELPLDEKPSFRILLASCRINLGNLRQRLLEFHGAVRAYDEAIAALGDLPRCGHRLATHHAATAWTNRGEALLSASPAEGAALAVDSAKTALAAIEGRDLGGAANAKLCLRALQVVARGLEAQEGAAAVRGTGNVAALTDVAERGMDLAFRNRDAAPGIFDPYIVWFFSFGGRAYGRHQPQFLAEYLEEALRRMDFLARPGPEAEIRALARQAASGALQGLGRNRMLVGGTLQTELLMRTVHELRGVAARLDP